MTVQGHAGLHTQRITGAQTCGLGAQLHQAIPQPHNVTALGIDLIAQRLTGIAGLGDTNGVTLQFQRIQGVFHRLGDGFAAGENLHQLLALGALHRNGCPIAGDVGDGAVEILADGAQMSQILLLVGRVDHQQIPFVLVAVQIRVIHGAAVRIGNDAVLGHVQVKACHIAGQNVLQKGQTVRPFNQQTAHVRHIEQGTGVTGIQVLGYNAGGILDGHFPSSEVHHGGAGLNVYIIQLCALKLTHAIPPDFHQIMCINGAI